jgi:8-oxo-dGTP pyrophosphatase MutT (NUDIX family)
MDRNILPFRKNCEGYLIFEDNIIGRNTEYGYIDFPGGGVEEGETYEDALRREAFEEAGVVIEDLKEVGSVKTVWPEDWAKNEKQKKRFEKFQGDEMHFFLGKVKELKKPNGDEEESGWNENDRFILINEAIEILESYRPFPKELEEYYEFKLKIIRCLPDLKDL